MGWQCEGSLKRSWALAICPKPCELVAWQTWFFKNSSLSKPVWSFSLTSLRFLLWHNLVVTLPLESTVAKLSFYMAGSYWVDYSTLTSHGSHTCLIERWDRCYDADIKRTKIPNQGHLLVWSLWERSETLRLEHSGRAGDKDQLGRGKREAGIIEENDAPITVLLRLKNGEVPLFWPRLSHDCSVCWDAVPIPIQWLA